MALTRVQATPQGQTNLSATVTLTFAAPPTVGNAVVVLVSNSGTGTVPATGHVTDNLGNSYPLVQTRLQNVFSASIFACPAITATGTPFTITIALNGTLVSITAQAIEVGGITGGGLEVDRMVANSAASGTAPTSGTTAALRTTADALAVGVLTAYSSVTAITVAVVSPPWTQEHKRVSGTNSCRGEGDSRLLTSPGGTTQSISWTTDLSQHWATVLVVFASDDAIPSPVPQVTQAVVETLSLPLLPAARVTQAPIEILSASGSSTPQVTQAVVELLTQGVVTVPDLTGLTLAAATAALTAAGLTLGTVTGTDGFVTTQSPAPGTQVTPGTAVAITIALPPSTPQVTQALAEVLSQNPVPPVVTQALVELLTPTDALPVRVTQLAVDVFHTVTISAAVTQLAVEVHHTQPATTRATQLVVEVFLVPGPCLPGYFLVDTLPAGGSCPAGLLP